MSSPPNAAPLPSIEFAGRAPGAWIRFVLPIVVGVSLDLYTKSLAARALLDRGDVTAIPGLLAFRYTENRGAVFGIGQGMISFFLVFSLIALGVVLFLFLTSDRRQSMVHLALGLITAGALGNFYDRVFLQHVRDFMLLFPNTHWYPYIFNVADVLLCVGVPLLIICWIVQSWRPQSSAP
jgi:signal peptidase II